MLSWNFVTGVEDSGDVFSGKALEGVAFEVAPGDAPFGSLGAGLGLEPFGIDIPLLVLASSKLSGLNLSNGILISRPSTRLRTNCSPSTRKYCASTLKRPVLSDHSRYFSCAQAPWAPVKSPPKTSAQTNRPLEKDQALETKTDRCVIMDKNSGNSLADAQRQ
jgi:hypothetical protein